MMTVRQQAVLDPALNSALCFTKQALVITCGCDQVHMGVPGPYWRSIQLLQRWAALLQGVYSAALLAVDLSFVGAYKLLPVLLSPVTTKHSHELDCTIRHCWKGSHAREHPPVCGRS